jgi:hypothetical protein
LFSKEDRILSTTAEEGATRRGLAEIRQNYERTSQDEEPQRCVEVGQQRLYEPYLL